MPKTKFRYFKSNTGYTVTVASQERPDGKTIGWGFAFCSPKDNFSRRKGRHTAVGRLMAEKGNFKETRNDYCPSDYNLREVWIRTVIEEHLRELVERHKKQKQSKNSIPKEITVVPRTPRKPKVESPAPPRPGDEGPCLTPEHKVLTDKGFKEVQTLHGANGANGKARVIKVHPCDGDALYVNPALVTGVDETRGNRFLLLSGLPIPIRVRESRKELFQLLDWEY